MIDFEKRVLENGLRVILAPMKSTEAVTLLVLAGVGSRYETKEINGVSHFLEHMFFKGTKDRPDPGQVHKDLNRIGAAYNAFTSKETTGFWVKTSFKDFDIGLDIVSDILLRPIFKDEEFQKERGVILQEIDMYEDNPMHKTQSLLEAMTLEDQPIGWDIAGTKETVSSVKKEDLISYEKENYLSRNIIVAVAGKFDKEETFVKIKAAFAELKEGKNKDFKKASFSQKEPRLKVTEKDSDQTHLAMGFRAYDMFDDKRYPANLLSTLLGGNTSSRLFTEIREKLGLAYYVYSWNDQFMDCGYIGMAAGVPHEKLTEVTEGIRKICFQMKSGEVSEADLDAAKSYIRGQTALRFESSEEIASFVANQELFYNEIKQPAEIIKKIERVKREEVISAASDIFKPEKANMSALGKHGTDNETKKKHEDILRSF
ncbi:insulinase family protein [Candidatus Parcubacteria bacterium]|nr:MAG: insulinase family protein [Candidatus Parcubacteria bacterium]